MYTLYSIYSILYAVYTVYTVYSILYTVCYTCICNHQISSPVSLCSCSLLLCASISSLCIQPSDSILQLLSFLCIQPRNYLIISVSLTRVSTHHPTQVDHSGNQLTRSTLSSISNGLEIST